MYSELLKEIINNNFNLNVIIDKNTDSGVVYKNDNEKYIHMNSKDIVDNTMDKLKNHLLDINNNSKDKLLLECLHISKKIIESKHENYKNNETLQKSIKDLITTIYETHKDKAIDISNSIITNIHKGY
jgi:adenosyl cobinamide kinase/adenosyl cobinamide phosphate guanylyltransferase